MMLGANASRGLNLLYIGRVIAGLGIGAASNLTPIYISEIAPPAIRGRLIGMYEVGWQFGGLVGFWYVFISSGLRLKSHSMAGLTMVSTRLFHPDTSNGLFLSLSNSSPLVYSSSVSGTCASLPDGSSARTDVLKPWPTFPGSATSTHLSVTFTRKST